MMWLPCVAVWLRGGARCDVAAVRRSVAAARRRPRDAVRCTELRGDGGSAARALQRNWLAHAMGAHRLGWLRRGFQGCRPS